MNPEIRAGLEERAKYYISLENFLNYFTREEGRCHEHGLVKHTVVGSRENQEVLAFYLSECIDKAVYGDLSAHNLGILVQNIRDGLRTATMKQNTFQPDGRLDPWTKFLAFVGVCYPWFGENKISLCNAFIPNHPYVIHMAIQRFLQQERSARGRAEPNRPTALANSAVANGNSQRNGASYTAEPNGPTALANLAVANGNSQRNGVSYTSGDGSAPAAAEENLSEEEKKLRHELALKDKDLALKDKELASLRWVLLLMAVAIAVLTHCCMVLANKVM